MPLLKYYKYFATPKNIPAFLELQMGIEFE